MRERKKRNYSETMKRKKKNYTHRRKIGRRSLNMCGKKRWTARARCRALHGNIKQPNAKMRVYSQRSVRIFFSYKVYRCVCVYVYIFGVHNPMCNYFVCTFLLSSARIRVFTCTCICVHSFFLS